MLKIPYLQPHTIESLTVRDAALASGNHQEAKILTSQLRRQVKNDNKQHQTEQLQIFLGSQQNWPAIKKLRAVCTAKFNKRGNKRASVPANFPNDCANYFAQTHWASITREPPPPSGAQYPTLLCADDTLLLSDTAYQLTRLLELVIHHSNQYNLALNKANCQLLVTNDPGHQVNFPDGSPVQKHDQINT